MRTIEISEETYEKIKDQLSDLDFELSCLKDLVGQKLFIRTVTYHLTGRVKSIFANFLALEDAAWIADSGRFMNAIMNGNLNEVEPVGSACVNLNSIVDFFPWNHDLPKEQQ